MRHFLFFVVVCISVFVFICLCVSMKMYIYVCYSIQLLISLRVWILSCVLRYFVKLTNCRSFSTFIQFACFSQIGVIFVACRWTKHVQIQTHINRMYIRYNIDIAKAVHFHWFIVRCQWNKNRAYILLARSQSFEKNITKNIHIYFKTEWQNGLKPATKQQKLNEEEEEGKKRARICNSYISICRVWVRVPMNRLVSFLLPLCFTLRVHRVVSFYGMRIGKANQTESHFMSLTLIWTFLCICECTPIVLSTFESGEIDEAAIASASAIDIRSMRGMHVFYVELKWEKENRITVYVLCMCANNNVSSIDIRFEFVSVLRAVCSEYSFSTAHNDHICLELFSLAVNETKIAEKDETTLYAVHIVGVVHISCTSV